jgi:diguanylate cyclase (GGDEF)-like protein
MQADDSSPRLSNGDPMSIDDTRRVQRCEALIDEARRGNVVHVEAEARQWRAQAIVAANDRTAGLAAHALGTCLLIQSRNAESIAVLVDAAQSALEHGDSDRYVRALVQSASALTDMGAHHRALELLADAGRLSDQPISERARYVMHSVRATLAAQVRNFDEALSHRVAAQRHADLEAGGLSSLINRWHTGELRFALAVDRARRNEVEADALLHRAANELLATAQDAAEANVPRIMLACRAAAAFAALWQADFETAQRIVDNHVDGDATSKATVDLRFRFACVNAILSIEDGAAGNAEIEQLLSEYSSAPVIERSAWLRLVGDVARTLNRADCANQAYLGVLALQDEIAAEQSAGLASVVRLRRDLDQLRDTARTAVAELQVVRSGHETLEARVANLQREVTLDALTGTVNRRGIDSLCNAWDYAPSSEPLSIAFVDIDRFKHANDTYGHAAGDRVLIAVATALRESVRETDTVARYAGDEFLMIFPDATVDVAIAASTRLLQRIEQLPPETAANFDDFSPTVSIGIATRRAGEDMKSVLRRADAALYEAKNQGRACFRVATD